MQKKQAVEKVAMEWSLAEKPENRNELILIKWTFYGFMVWTGMILTFSLISECAILKCLWELFASFYDLTTQSTDPKKYQP